MLHIVLFVEMSFIIYINASINLLHCIFIVMQLWLAAQKLFMLFQSQYFLEVILDYFTCLLRLQFILKIGIVLQAVLFYVAL